MTNGYSYIDPDHTYTDPRSGVMRNIAGIDDERLLVAFESLKVSARLEELRAKPLKIKNADSLLAIHKQLFQDIYDWAGKIRTVEISKGGTGKRHRTEPQPAGQCRCIHPLYGGNDRRQRGITVRIDPGHYRLKFYFL